MDKTQLAPYLQASVRHVSNASVQHGNYPQALSTLINPAKAEQAQRQIKSWPGYAPTPMHQLANLAEATGVGTILYKDESHRLGLQSFKALGGPYAVEQLLLQEISKHLQTTVSYESLVNGDHHSICRDITLITATDGNHGCAVAWGARRYGCRCVIYIHTDVSTGRQRALESHGAEVIRVTGNYDDSVRLAARAAADNGWFVVSDTAYPGYTDIPVDIMHGYTLMGAEILDQLESAPTHVFIQGGCGGFAAAVIGYLWVRYKQQRPRFVIVEPQQADCIYQSIQAGTPVTVAGKHDTMMAGLACGEVSLVAWPVIKAGAGDCLAITDEVIKPTVQMLHARGIEAGESAVAGLAGALMAAGRPDLRNTLGLSGDSVVLVFGTEGASDPAIYQAMIRP